MKIVKMTFAALSIAASASLLLLVANALVPIYLADTLYLIGGIGLVSGVITYIFIVIE